MVLENKRDSIEKILKKIGHPEIAHSLFNLGMIKDIYLQGSKVTLTLKVPMLDIPIKDHLMDDIKSALKKEDENVKTEINIEEMDGEERAKFMKMAQDAWRG